MTNRNPSRRRDRRTEGASSGLPGPSRRLWAAVLVVALLAGALSVYLTYAYFKVREGTGWRSFCDVSSRLSCDAVTASDYSAVMGVPIAWLATLFYVAVAWAACGVLRGGTKTLLRSPALGLLVGGAVASATSVALAVVSMQLIDALCPLCLILYAANAGLLALGVVAVRRGSESLGEAVVAECNNLRRHLGRTIMLVALAATLLVALPLARTLRSPSAERGGLADLCAYAQIKRAGGDRSDKIRIVVYTDYQCPFCKKADLVLAGARSADGVLVEMRNFPLDQACNPGLPRTVHEGACRQAAAVICAGRRGDELGRLIFEGGAKDARSLVGLALGLGLDTGEFASCLRSEEAAKELAADIDAARRDGVRGTPTILIDGRHYRGPIEPAAFDCLASRGSAP